MVWSLTNDPAALRHLLHLLHLSRHELAEFLPGDHLGLLAQQPSQHRAQHERDALPGVNRVHVTLRRLGIGEKIQDLSQDVADVLLHPSSSHLVQQHHVSLRINECVFS